jgi:hypothetical protein
LGDSLLDGAVKINDNFDEIYTYFGDGTNLTFTGGSSSQWVTTSAGIHTLSNVGIGTTNPTENLTVFGDARVTGILTIGTASITLDGSSNTITVGSGVTIDGSTGIIEATSLVIEGTTLTGAAVTSITAGTGISVDQSTGNVTISATGGGGGEESYWTQTSSGIHTLSNVGIGTTNPTSALTVVGDTLVSGVVTATSFVGDGSGLTGVVGSGSGVVVKDSGSTVGTAGTIDFGDNLSVSAISAGVVTVTASGGSGDVSGPGSSTDNAVTRFDGTTGKLIQNSLVTIGDDGAIVAPQAGSIIPFYFDNQAAFPSASTYHGALAHSHADGGMFYAHGGVWIQLADASDISWVQTAAGIHTLSNVGIGTTNPESKLTIIGDAFISGVVTATSFIGNASSATYADSAGISTNVSGGTASVTSLSVSGISTLGTVQVSSGIVTAASGTVIYYGDTSNTTDGRWILGASGTSDYTFTGIGFTQTTNDPILYLARGRVYEFVNNSGGSHPFQIRVSNGGSAYNDGVTNNGAASGVIRFEIPFNAPNTLYYQCTVHSGMGNTISVYPSTI